MRILPLNYPISMEAKTIIAGKIRNFIIILGRRVRQPKLLFQTPQKIIFFVINIRILSICAIKDRDSVVTLTLLCVRSCDRSCICLKDLKYFISSEKASLFFSTKKPHFEACFRLINVLGQPCTCYNSIVGCHKQTLKIHSRNR